MKKISLRFALSMLIASCVAQAFAQSPIDAGETLFDGGVSNGEHLFIDRTGRVRLTVSHKEVWQFHEGLAAFRENNKCGFIDARGAVVIPPQDVCAYEFHEGMALFDAPSGCKGAEEKRFYGFIGRDGRIAIAPALHRPCSAWGSDFYSFHDGLAFVELEGKSGFIDKTGRVVMTFDAATPFSEKLAAVKTNGNGATSERTGSSSSPRSSMKRNRSPKVSRR